MEQKTKIRAEDGQQDVFITREFELPVELLFRAHVEPEIVAQVMGTKVVRLENKQHGSYEFETTDGKGNVVFKAVGVIHAFEPNRKITKTFEMVNTPFGVQLEFYVFEPLTDDTSRLTMHVVYESAAQRDQILKMGMPQGLGMAHDRMQAIVDKLK
jgi:uncharacterized protein YndB with AHSA1/START domain